MTAWVRSVVATTCLALTSLLVPAAYSQHLQPRNLVVNGDFSEDGGSLNGWTSNQNVDNFYWQPATTGTTNYASNGCFGVVCINGSKEERNYLYQILPTIPGLKYKLTFTYDAGEAGANELQVHVGGKVVQDIVNAAQGPNTYTVEFIARQFETKLNFRGRQDVAFSFLTDISVTRVRRDGDRDDY